MNKLEKIELTIGEQKTLNFNRPVDFVIETTSGTTISGKILPNNPITIKPMGDILKFDITINEDSFKKIEKI